MNEKKDIKYDLFISYCQYDSGKFALNIEKELKDKNLNIFLDVNSDMKDLHNLEDLIEMSKNVLLLITDDIFERYYVQLELRAALKNKKNIIVLWDKYHCPNFPKKEKVPEDLREILNIKAITWYSEEEYIRNATIDEIVNNMKNIFNNHKVNIKTYYNTYLRANLDKRWVQLNDIKPNTFDTFEIIDCGNNNVAFKCIDGRYIKSCNKSYADCGVLLNDNLGTWEEHKIIKKGDYWNIYSVEHEKYWKAYNNINLRCESDEPRECEMFKIEIIK